MKRIFCLALSLLLAASLVSCNQDNRHNSSSADSSRLTLSTGATVSVKEYVLKGEIHGCEFKLGTAVQEIKDAYHYGEDEYWGAGDGADSSEMKHNIDATPLEIYGEDPVRMVTGDAKYYYHPSSEDNGIAYIAYFGDAYGLRVGISEPDDVRTAVGETALVDGFAQGNELFFFFGEPEGVYQLGYDFNDQYRLSFYFENGKLAATTLYSVDLWATDLR